MAHFAEAALLAALPLAILAGCAEPGADREPGPPSALASVQGIVQTADVGSFMAASFAGGSAHSEASVEGYRVLAGVAGAEACAGVLRAATPTALRFTVGGQTLAPEDLGSSSKRKRRSIRRLCSAATYPTTIQVVRYAPPPGIGGN